MTARRRAILIVVLALLMIGIVVALVLLLTRKAPQAAPSPTPTVEQPQPVPTLAPQDIIDALRPVPPPASPGSTAAAQIAELFAERYGSYSNQGDFQNLKDLLPVMTASYKAATEAYLATATASDASNYQGVTSVKVSTQVRSYSAAAGTAVVAVMLQQQKSTGASAVPALTYRSLKMSLKLVGKDWKVDSATWEN